MEVGTATVLLRLIKRLGIQHVDPSPVYSPGADGCNGS